jgi:tRNA threonylcarbamoyl adenosine modification protein YeaZ
MILIINTSLANTIELCLDGNCKHIHSEKQALDLPDAVNDLVDNFSNLTAIGVVVGPGSFTGIRLGIAYAKGLGIGLNIPVVSVNAFELYLESAPDAFVAIDSGRGDFFVASAQHEPCIMTIDQIESEQMKCASTVGHLPYDLQNAFGIIKRKLELGITEPVIPMYLRPSYAELNYKNNDK